MRVLRALLSLGAALALAGCSAGAGDGPTARADEMPSPEAVHAADATTAGDEGAATPAADGGDDADPTSSGADAPGTSDTTAGGAFAASAAVEPAGDPGEPMGYAEAYDLLYAAIEPSDALVDRWNAAADAEDWRLVRTMSGRLAESLQTLQTTVLAAAWPTDAQAAAQDFAIALDAEIGWYSYVSIARDDAETLEAVRQPWSDVAVTTANALWTVLEDGIAAAD